MTRILPAWLAMLLATGGAAQPSPAQAPATPTGSIPFTLQDNLVVVDVTINGRRQSAVLDSGAGAWIVSRALAQRLGLQEGDVDGEAAGGGPAAQQLRPVTIAELRVGPLVFGAAAAQALDLGQLSSSANFPIDLLIGAPAFRSGLVRVDYRRRLVTFAPSGSGKACAAPIPLSIVHDVPVVEAELRPGRTGAPVRLKLIVDLGNRHRALLVGGPFLRSEAGRALASSGTAQKVGHGTGGEVLGSLARAEELRIGDATYPGVEVALTSGVTAFEASGLDGAIGVPLWQSGAITFDYPARTLCIET